MQSSIFCVNEEPYCIWEGDIKERNNEFLNGVDTGFFSYSLGLHCGSEDEKRASVAVRTIFHHAMETMFSFLGAYVQAPDCVYAWIAKCSNSELRGVVKKISDRKELFVKVDVSEVSWCAVADAVFNCYLPGTERQQETVRLFGTLWERLAREFVNQIHVDEYNSLKHGFRVRSGGFSIAFGVEHEFGVAPPREEMKEIGGSEFGGIFYRVEAAGKRSRSLLSRRVSCNWSIERTALLLRLVEMSTKNIVSALKILNGAEPQSCEFSRPSDAKEFERPWSFSPGVHSCIFDSDVPREKIPLIEKSELIRKTKELIKK